MIAQPQVKRQQSPWKDHWYTPEPILCLVEEVIGAIYLDPATSENNPTGAEKFYTPEQNGLRQPWSPQWFLNPPFSQKAEWLEKASREGGIYEGIAIVPSGCLHNKGTRRFVAKANAVAMLDRVAFVPSPQLMQVRQEQGLEKASNSPPDDMVLLYFGSSPMRFAQVLEKEDYPVYRGFWNREMGGF